MENKVKHRNSSIELLRVIAILFVCLSHSAIPPFDATRTVGGFFPYDGVANITCNFLLFFGEIANIIFAICASYFLCDSRKTNYEKFFAINFDSFFISVFCLIGLTIGGFYFSADVVVRQFFPTILFAQHFISRYLLIYLFHPLINRILDKFSFKTFSFCVGGILLIMPFVVNPLLRFFDMYEISANPFSFLFIYIVVTYFKKFGLAFFNKKRNCYLIISIGVPIFYLLQVLMIFYSKSLVMQYFFVILTSYFSPFVLLPIFAIFILVSKLEFYSKTINYLASGTMLVYCFHGNVLISQCITPQYFTRLSSFFNGGSNEFFMRILLGFILFASAYLASIIYQESVQRFTKIISKKTGTLCDKAVNKLKNKFAKHK